MTNIERTISTPEKIGLFVSLASLVLTFIGLILSDNVSSLFNGANIVANKQEIYLKPLINKDEYIGVINISNNGTKASMNAKIIIEFDSKVPIFEVISDETFKEKKAKGNKLIITLDRLSNNSGIKITMHSKSQGIKRINYIDDSGNQEIVFGGVTKEFNLFNLGLLIIMLISLFAIIWIYRRVSENYLVKTLEYYQNDMEEKLREIKDEISNIEIIVNPPAQSNIETPESSISNITRRLGEFITAGT